MNEDVLKQAGDVVVEAAKKDIHEKLGFATDGPKRPWWRPWFTCKCTCLMSGVSRVPMPLPCGCIVLSEPVQIRWRRPKCWRHQRKAAKKK